jgi:hypothetical protein
MATSSTNSASCCASLYIGTLYVDSLSHFSPNVILLIRLVGGVVTAHCLVVVVDVFVAKPRHDVFGTVRLPLALDVGHHDVIIFVRQVHVRSSGKDSAIDIAIDIDTAVFGIPKQPTIDKLGTARLVQIGGTKRGQHGKDTKGTETGQSLSSQYHARIGQGYGFVWSIVDRNARVRVSLLQVVDKRQDHGPTSIQRRIGGVARSSLIIVATLKGLRQDSNRRRIGRNVSRVRLKADKGKVGMLRIHQVATAKMNHGVIERSNVLAQSVNGLVHMDRHVQLIRRRIIVVRGDQVMLFGPRCTGRMTRVNAHQSECHAAQVVLHVWNHGSNGRGVVRCATVARRHCGVGLRWVVLHTRYSRWLIPREPRDNQVTLGRVGIVTRQVETDIVVHGRGQAQRIQERQVIARAVAALVKEFGTAKRDGQAQQWQSLLHRERRLGGIVRILLAFLLNAITIDVGTFKESLGKVSHIFNALPFVFHGMCKSRKGGFLWCCNVGVFVQSLLLWVLILDDRIEYGRWQMMVLRCAAATIGNTQRSAAARILALNSGVPYGQPRMGRHLNQRKCHAGHDAMKERPSSHATTARTGAVVAAAAHDASCVVRVVHGFLDSSGKVSAYVF